MAKKVTKKNTTKKDEVRNCCCGKGLDKYSFSIVVLILYTLVLFLLLGYSDIFVSYDDLTVETAFIFVQTLMPIVMIVFTMIILGVGILKGAFKK